MMDLVTSGGGGETQQGWGFTVSSLQDDGCDYRACSGVIYSWQAADEHPHIINYGAVQSLSMREESLRQLIAVSNSPTKLNFYFSLGKQVSCLCCCAKHQHFAQEKPREVKPLQNNVCNSLPIVLSPFLPNKNICDIGIQLKSAEGNHPVEAAAG